MLEVKAQVEVTLAWICFVDHTSPQVVGTLNTQLMDFVSISVFTCAEFRNICGCRPHFKPPVTNVTGRDINFVVQPSAVLRGYETVIHGTIRMTDRVRAPVYSWVSLLRGLSVRTTASRTHAACRDTFIVQHLDSPTATRLMKDSP